MKEKSDLKKLLVLTLGISAGFVFLFICFIVLTSDVPSAEATLFIGLFCSAISLFLLSTETINKKKEGRCSLKGKD